MVSIEELKLGNETLEALNYLLSQISDLQGAVSAISMSEIKDANTLTKEQIATLKDVKSVVESIKEELGSKKLDFDKKKEKFDIDFSTFSSDKLDFDSKNSVALRNFNEIIATANEVKEAKESTQSASGKSTQNLNDAREILEKLRAIANTIQDLTNKTKSDIAELNLDELTALKGSLIELKKALEVIRETGLINDNSANTTQTYSSQKLDTLLSKKLDVSDKEAMFSDGKIKTELLPNIDATTLNGKKADDFELKTQSTAKYTALSQNIGTLEGSLEAKIDTSLKGVANGVATLNNGGTLEITQIPPQVVTIDNFGALVADTVNTEGFTLGYYVNKDKIVQELGEHKDLIMSQKAVNDALKTNVMPVGSYMLFSSNTNTPDGFLRCDGSALDKTTYAALFAVIGYTYGRSGDKFLLPNFSDGKFMRSIGGNAAALGIAQGDAIRNITGRFQTSSEDFYSETNPNTKNHRGWGAFERYDAQGSRPIISVVGKNLAYDFNASRVVPTANENRPLNMAVVVLIKY